MKKNILIFGAGKSTTVLIQYLLDKSRSNQWTLTIVDSNPLLAQSKIGNHPNGIALSFDILRNPEQRSQAVATADIVISMLLPGLHRIIAQDCIKHKKHLLTASYVDEYIKSLEPIIKRNQLLFLCEMGLDPGIDHMSAMQMIHKIIDLGGQITSFKSHCGGLVAPKFDNNPWHYKITWNPANVVNAGKSGAVYKRSEKLIKAKYADVFKNCEMVAVPSMGNYAAYPNRDAIPYSVIYNLEHIPNFIRTTLRHPHFCIGWKHIIDIGLTNEQFNIKPYLGQPVSYWFLSSLKTFTKYKSWNEYLSKAVAPENQQLINTLFEFLGLFSNEIIPETFTSSAAVLQYLIEKYWVLLPNEHDMIIMQHEIDYQIGNNSVSAKSTLVVEGNDARQTAMAKTVGLPLAIATELILTGSITITGLHIPVVREIYEPVLKKLYENKICFSEI